MRRWILVSTGVLIVFLTLFLLDGPFWAMQTRGGIDPAVRSAMGRLHSWRGSTRAAATVESGLLGPAAAPAAPALVEHLDDFGWVDFQQGLSTMFAFHGGPKFVCVQASEALTAIGPGAVPALIGGLKNPREHVRAFSAELLAAQPASNSSLAALRYAALHDPSDTVKNAAAGALGKHHDTAILAEVAGLLRDSNPRKRVMAVLLIESLNTPESEALVTSAVQDPDQNVQQAAGYALERLARRR